VLYDDSRYWSNLTFVIYYNQLRLRVLPTAADTCMGATSELNTITAPLAISNGNNNNHNPLAAANGQLNVAQVTSLEQYFGQTTKSVLAPTQDNFSSMLLYTAEAALANGQLTWPLPPPMSTGVGQMECTNGSTFYSKMLMMPLTHSPKWTSLDSFDFRARLYYSIKVRGFDSICLLGATDEDIIEFTTQFALIDGLDKFVHISVRHSPITDKGLEVFLASIARSLKTFELIGKCRLSVTVIVIIIYVEFVGCNEISDSGLWTGLVPNLKCLAIQDCINVSDETIAAICQLLTSLKALHIQVSIKRLVNSSNKPI